MLLSLKMTNVLIQLLVQVNKLFHQKILHIITKSIFISVIIDTKVFLECVIKVTLMTKTVAYKNTNWNLTN